MMGELAMRAFVGRQSEDEQAKSRERHRAQLTGLENIAETAHKVSEVLDFIKKQFARPGLDAWRKPVRGKRFGEEVKNFIEQNLKEEARNICLELALPAQGEEGQRYEQEIYLELIRQFIRQLVVHYEYLVQYTSLNTQDKEVSRDAHRAGTTQNTPDQ